ncbi:MAG: hypothetical protein ACJAYU_002265 [Bradymonadia bacterium]|jgi:hypothetical protein
MRHTTPAKPERDLSKVYTVFIGVVAVALVAVLLLGTGGDGAVATVNNLQLTQEPGGAAEISYEFWFERLPEDSDSVVIRLASPAFTTPVLVPWDSVSDLPPITGSSYLQRTSIEATLRDQVTQREAVVTVSIESGGSSAGRDRVDIQELYNFGLEAE